MLPIVLVLVIAAFVTTAASVVAFIYKNRCCLEGACEHRGRQPRRSLRR